MSKVRVADFVASWFNESLGTQNIFLVTGAGSMHLTDGVAQNPNLSAICLHHEQSVSMAVEAYSRISSEIGVAYVSTGPAATNAVTGVAGAWQDSVACFFISGQVKVSEMSARSGVVGLRQFGVQELDIIPIVASITKYSATVLEATDILYELQKAHYLAMEGRPGPVWLEIPMDVQSALISPGELRQFEPPQPASSPHTELKELRRLVAELTDSQRPVLLVGQGVRLASAGQALKRFVEKHKVPVVSSYLGADSYLPHDDSYIGKIGVKGERAANIAVQKSDFLLVLGSSLHVSSIGYNYDEFAPLAVKWVIDIDKTSHKKSTVRDANFVSADVLTFLEAVMEELKVNQPGFNRMQWSKIASDLREQFPTCPSDYELEQEGVNIYQVVSEVNKVLGDQDLVISDAGSAFYAVTQGVNLSSENQRYLTSGAMATMGYSLPAAIGASIARPQSQVFAFTGDGSLHQNLQELGQLKFLGCPVVLIVLNNAGYLSIRASQINYFANRFIGTDSNSGLGLPDIPEICRAYGLRTFEIKGLDELRKVLREVSGDMRPVVLNVRTPMNQAIVPTVSSRLDVSGKMISRSIHDMTPLLDEERLAEIMLPDWGFEIR